MISARCEGISAAAALVPPEVIRANNNLYNAYNKNFPAHINGGDVDRFLLSAAVTADVVRGVRGYLEAEGTIVGADKISVFLKGNKHTFFDKLKYEAIRATLSGSESLAFLAVPQLSKIFASAGEFDRDLGNFLVAHSTVFGERLQVTSVAAGAPYPLLLISPGGR